MNQNKAYFSLLQALDQEKAKRFTAEENNHYYMKAFEFLDTQDWFKENRHHLTRFVREDYPSCQ